MHFENPLTTRKNNSLEKHEKSLPDDGAKNVTPSPLFPQNGRALQLLESRPVLCTLRIEAVRNAYEEVQEKMLASLSDCIAVHDEFLCRDEDPCVVIVEGCNSRNIVSVLVHESIHHVLLWLEGDFAQIDTFDKICKKVSECGFRL